MKEMRVANLRLDNLMVVNVHNLLDLLIERLKSEYFRKNVAKSLEIYFEANSNKPAVSHNVSAYSLPSTNRLHA